MLFLKTSKEDVNFTVEGSTFQTFITLSTKNLSNGMIRLIRMRNNYLVCHCSQGSGDSYTSCGVTKVKIAHTRLPSV